MAGELGKLLLLGLLGYGGYQGQKRQNKATEYDWQRQAERDKVYFDRAAREKADYDLDMAAEREAGGFTSTLGGSTMPSAPQPIGYNARIQGMAQGLPIPNGPDIVTPGMTREQALTGVTKLSPRAQRLAAPGVNTYLQTVPEKEKPLAPSMPASPTQIALARQALQRLGLDPSLLPDAATVDDLEQLNSLLTTLRVGAPEAPGAPARSYNEQTTGVPAPSYANTTESAPTPLPRRAIPAPPILPQKSELPSASYLTGGLPGAPMLEDIQAPPPMDSTAPTGVQAPTSQYPNELDVLMSEIGAAKNLDPETAIKAFNAIRPIAEMYPDAPVHPVPIIDAKTRRADFLRDSEGKILLLPKAVAEQYSKDYSTLLGKDVPNAVRQISIKAWSPYHFEGAIKKSDPVSKREWYEGNVSINDGDQLPTNYYPFEGRPQPFTYPGGRTVYKTPSEIAALKGQQSAELDLREQKRKERETSLNAQAEARMQKSLGLEEKKYQDQRREAASGETLKKLDRLYALTDKWRQPKLILKDGKWQSGGKGWEWKPGTPETVKSEILQTGNEIKGELQDGIRAEAKAAGLSGKMLEDFVKDQMKAMGYEQGG